MRPNVFNNHQNLFIFDVSCCETLRSNFNIPRSCLYEKKHVLLSGISLSHGKSFLFSLCVYMTKRTGLLTEISPLKGNISVSGMNRNPYKHFSQPAEVNFNRGAHAHNVRIQTTMTSVKSITRHN